ncbi:hypothetical protein E3N88_17984 [Mikania micrantha]|uniref:Transposase, Ptta/En/Spm, plant n=1 Tax=Mikania micrantha TaxID=192012 RepID=A0A5N6NW49_9ASTR|nr:hypothetical protein E3N88_17984 [Mikania micrantha]
MNKFANLAKQNRVIAPKVSQKYPLDSDASKDKHSKATVTMAELISCNKWPQRQMEIMKNQIQMDDSEDDLGNEDDVLIQEQLQGSKLQKAIESKIRGPTMLHVVHTRKVDDRDVIICNEFGQPVGPVTNEKDIVGRFSRFLGTIARNHSYASLIHSSRHKVPHKDKIWEYVLEKYEVPDAAKKWVLMTIGHSYKINDDPNKELPTLTKMFEHTRKRTEGRAYVDTYDDTERKIEQMKNYKSSENENASADPFMIVMNKENSGYCRLYGRGQKHELVEMRKKLDEEHERKRTELEAIQLDIKNQQEHLEATMRKLMEQLLHKD